MTNRKKRQKKEYKDAGDRFRQISDFRARKLKKIAIQINRMLPQPSYQISQKDAQELYDYLADAVTPLLDNLRKISEGQALKGKVDIEPVYQKEGE